MFAKKFAFILALMLTCWISTFAQEQDRWSLGPRVGVNFSNVSNVDESKSLTGLALGLTTTYSISQSSGITFDLLYSSEGYTSTAGPTDADYKLRYLQIPIYYDVFFGDLGSAFRPKVYLGIEPGFFLNAKVNDDESNKDFYNKFTMGLSGGLGFNLRVANKIWLNTDLRSNWGLSDVRDKDYQTGDAIKLRTVQPSIGLCYGFSRFE